MDSVYDGVFYFAAGVVGQCIRRDWSCCGGSCAVGVYEKSDPAVVTCLVESCVRCARGSRVCGVVYTLNARGAVLRAAVRVYDVGCGRGRRLRVVYTRSGPMVSTVGWGCWCWFAWLWSGLIHALFCLWV